MKFERLKQSDYVKDYGTIRRRGPITAVYEELWERLRTIPIDHVEVVLAEAGEDLKLLRGGIAAAMRRLQKRFPDGPKFRIRTSLRSDHIALWKEPRR